VDHSLASDLARDGALPATFAPTLVAYANVNDRYMP